MRIKPSRERSCWPRFLLISLACVLIVGCATQSTVDEKIYRISSATGTNYYRVRINSKATNGKAQFKAGLYPAYAVDMFRGQESELPSEMMDAESEFRKKVIQAQTGALDKYLQATNQDARERAADELVAAQEIVLGSGGTVMGKSGNVQNDLRLTVPMEFNPVKSLVDHMANKKFVIALSSDPDEILNSISAFVEEAKTTDAVQQAITSQLSGVKLAEVERVRQKNRALVLQNLIALLQEKKDTQTMEAAELAAWINKLKSALEGLK